MTRSDLRFRSLVPCRLELISHHPGVLGQQQDDQSTARAARQKSCPGRCEISIVAEILGIDCRNIGLLGTEIANCEFQPGAVATARHLGMCLKHEKRAGHS
jgi:hypothetical protein